MTDKPGLRQRKKERTRARLIEVSQRMFREQGYDATTLEQICDEAEVSVPTLLTYFESKERLALAPDYDFLAVLRGEIVDPQRSEDTLTLWRRWVERGAEYATRNRRDYLRSIRTLSSTLSLAKGQLILLQGYEEVLADGLARDYGTDPTRDVPTALLATMLSFGNHTVLRQWARSGGKDDLRVTAVAVVDFAIEKFPKPGRRFG